MDGECTECGAYIKIVTDNMELGNSLALQFWVDKSQLKEGVEYYAVLTRTFADEKAKETTTVPMSQWLSTDGHYLIKYGNLAAKEMTDEVSVQIFEKGGRLVSNKFTDSIREYAMWMLAYYETISGEEELVTVMIDMLNYGAAAQNQFGYAKDDLANNQLTDAQQGKATQTIEPQDHWSSLNKKATTSNLALESNIVLRIWFENVTAGMYAEVSYKDHYGRPVEKTIQYADFVVENNGQHVVAIDTLVVADGSQIVTCTMYNADGTVFDTCTESVESYVYIMRVHNLDTYGLYEAIMKFVDSSYSYFH